MVGATIIAGMFGFLGTLFLGFLYTTLWTWRHSASLGGDDEERVVELESHQKSKLDDELTKLFINIDGRLDSRDDLPPDINERDHIANVINREIGEEDIRPVVDELDSVDQPVSIFDDHRNAYRTASRDFMWGGLATLALAGSMAVVTVWNGDPFSDSIASFFYFLLILGVVSKGYDGVQNFLKAQSLKDEFEDLWRKYKRID
ncbi:hypothetical protein [Halobellus inordinatus]|uniref:hypothetical protein n=1 Tax=Halobellus inordinatus TaxID=1126236 RepID=UPI0021144CA0|nr:hypothetical protein [Halobellus ramosii]